MAPREIIDAFMAIKDSASRRAVLNGIMNNLSWREIREVKSWAKKWTFQCDILAKLPLEIVALTVQYLNLKDLFALRRVSKLWYGMLTSTTVLSAVIRGYQGNNAIQPGASPEVLEKLIVKRVRAENAMPAVVATFPNNLSTSILDDMSRDVISIFNGVCAWIENSTNRTSICIVHLRSGKTRNLTTENRESLTHIKVSDTLISAISIRGYCHVWKLATEEYKCFRIPSLRFFHHVSYGSKVLLSYTDSIVHFNFDTGTARTATPGRLIFCVSVHPVEDQFSVICIRSKNMDNHPIRDEGIWVADTHQLQIQTYSICDNGFVCTWEQYQESPFQHCDIWVHPSGSVQYSRSLRPGQSSRFVHPFDRYYELYLSLDAHTQIIGHLEPEHRAALCPKADLDYSSQGPGLIYDYHVPRSPSCRYTIRIGAEYPETLDVCPDANVVQFEAKLNEIQVSGEKDRRIIGDGDFVLFYRPDGEIGVWCFDETWDPSNIPDAAIRGQFGMHEDWEKCRGLLFQ